MSFLQLRSGLRPNTNHSLLPAVETDPVTGIASTSATGNGAVLSDGGYAITERGVCWSTSSNPTTSDSKATSSGTIGIFTASITGLSASTTYHVRAYAINANGTTYGVDVTFAASAVVVTGGGQFMLMGMGM